MKVSLSAWRISVGSMSARAGAGGFPVSCSSNRTLPAWIDVSWTPPVPSRDGAGFVVPDWDIRAGFSPRRHWWSRRRAVDVSASGASRVSVKTAIALPARESHVADHGRRKSSVGARLKSSEARGCDKRLRREDPASAAYRRAKALLFLVRHACGRAAKRRNSSLSRKPLDPCEARTSLQHPSRHRRGAGRAGAHSCRARLCAHRRAGHGIPAHLRVHSVALRHIDRARRRAAGRLRRATVDLRDLCADPRRLDALRRQCGVAAAVWQRGGAAVRRAAVPCVLRGDGGGRRGAASRSPMPASRCR